MDTEPGDLGLRNRQDVDYDALLEARPTNGAMVSPDLSLASLVESLSRAWCDAYRRLGGSPDIVEVTEGGFSYLFDVSGERPIAAYGRVGRRPNERRDRSRQAGYPRSADPGYQKGHLIAHRLGGGLDINIVHQLGAANAGRFRCLEAEAARNPGSLYFVRLLYASTPLPRGEQPSLGREARAPAGSQRPRRIEQGLILPRLPLRLTYTGFEN